jgi:hypothetical protein
VGESWASIGKLLRRVWAEEGLTLEQEATHDEGKSCCCLLARLQRRIGHGS